MRRFSACWRTERVPLRARSGSARRVPAEQAQLIRDKLGTFGGASLDVPLRIADLQAGGAIVTEVVEYELRVERSGERLGGVRVGE